VWPNHALSEAHGGPFWCLQLLVAAGKLCYSLTPAASLTSLPLSPCVFFSHIGHQPYYIRGQPYSSMTSSDLQLHSQWPYFRIRSQSKALGLGLPTFLQGHAEPMTDLCWLPPALSSLNTGGQTGPPTACPQLHSISSVSLLHALSSSSMDLNSRRGLCGLCFLFPALSAVQTLHISSSMSPSLLRLPSAFFPKE
jgi:hypothetical protein